MTVPTGELGLRPFALPPRAVQIVLQELYVTALDPPEDEAELEHLASIPRPWDPAACPSRLQQQIMEWLGEVVFWVNEQHLWRVDPFIPECWDLHPHIINELAPLACQRYFATLSATPEALLDWQRYVLPPFLERMTQRAGSGLCPPGRHSGPPGLGRLISRLQSD